MFSTSSIWSPQRMTGLSAVIGSWKTIDMRAPRSSRSRASPAARRFSPSRRIFPPLTGSAFGSRPMIACAITLFPDPDSPTRHRISPRLTAKDTPLTACPRSAPGGSAMARSSTSSVFRSRLSYSLGHLWIQCVAQPVAEDVDREHRDREEDAREEHVVRIRDELDASLGHDVAPGGDVGREPDPEEGEDRLEQDGERADVGALHE